MRLTVTAMVAALAMAGCSQGGNQQANRAADPGLPGGGSGGRTATPSGNGAQPTPLAGVTADPGAAVSNCLSAEDQTRRPEDMDPAERAEKIGCINAAMAAQINRQLPAKVDSVTTLNRVEADGMTITYHYTADVQASQLPPGAMDTVKAGARSNACGNPQMRQNLGYGAAYEYRWADKNGRALGELRIDRC